MARMGAPAYTDRLTAPRLTHTLWSRPRWALAVLLGSLGMLGPFSIDTYLPAFTGIAQSLGATPVRCSRRCRPTCSASR